MAVTLLYTMHSPSPQGPAPRNSSLELLRLLAMLLILLLHANFPALGFPSASEAQAQPLSTLAQLASEALCIVAVNCFVLLSGFFGIRLRGEGLASLFFQSAFYGAVAYLVALALTGGAGGFKLGTFLGQSLPLAKSGGWFVPAYVGLMLLSPLLERALAQLSTRQLGRYLALYYGLHTIWVFLFKTIDQHDGYSIFSFIGIYLLGSYLRRTKERWKRIPRWRFLASYVGISIGSALLILGISIATGLTLRGGALPYWFMSYASPLVIASAVSLFLFFARERFYAPWINALAGSTLAVYLLHCNDALFPHYLHFVRQLHAEPLALFLLSVLAFALVVFALSLLIDQLRLVLWKRAVRPVYLRLEGYLRRRL